MDIRSTNNPYGDTQMVDRLIGTAYDIVKTVYENLQYIKHVSANLPQIQDVYEDLAKINAVEAELVRIGKVADEIAKVVTVADNIVQVDLVAAQMTALLAVYNDLASVITTAQNITAVNTVANSIVAVGVVATNMDDINTLVENLPAIENVVANIPTILTAVADAEAARDLAQQYAQDAFENAHDIAWASDTEAIDNTNITKVMNPHTTYVAFEHWKDSISTLIMQPKSFTGVAGSNQTYALDSDPGAAKNVFVYLGGVRQIPLTHYTVSGTTLTILDNPDGLEVDTLIFGTTAVLNTLGGKTEEDFATAAQGILADNAKPKVKGVLDFGSLGGIPNSPAASASNGALLETLLTNWRNGDYGSQIRIEFGPGEWRIGGTHNLEAPAYWYAELVGMGSNITYIASDASGADTKFLYAGANRQNRISLRGINFLTRNAAGTVCPILLSTPRKLEDDWTDVRFTQTDLTGTIGNTLVECSGLWNTTMRDLHTFGGGLYKPSNPLSSTVTFTLNSTTSVVASEAVFSAADVGRKFLFGSAGGKWIGTVASVTDSTHVVMTEAAPYTGATEYGWAEPIKATTTAGSTSVTLSGAGAVASDVGRWVIIRDTGIMTSVNSFHVAKITAVTDSSTIVVSPAPPRSGSNKTIYFSPVFMFWNDSAGGIQATNDILMDNCRMEIFSGLGMCIAESVQVKLLEHKIHGMAQSSIGYQPNLMSQAGMLIHTLIIVFYLNTNKLQFLFM